MADILPMPRKRRTREHVIADLSVNQVERQVLLCGYTAERRTHDYGIDLVLLTYSDVGEVESGEILLQLKATDHLETRQHGEFVSIRVERSDLRAWLAEPMPLILVVYDAQKDRAFWLYVQAAVSGTKGLRSTKGSGRVTVRIPTTQRLGPAAVRRFRGFRDAVLAQSEGVIHRE